MQSISKIRTFSVILLGLVALLQTSCQYDPDFDALSVFPSNGQQKTIDEIELIPVNQGG